MGIKFDDSDWAVCFSLSRVRSVRPSYLLVSLRLLAFYTVLNATVSLAIDETHPNVVLILADDLAWADLGCHGHPWHETPHIDQLAEQGVRFTNAYASAPICSASRASLLTGKTTARLGFEFVTKNESGYQRIDSKTPLVAPPFTLNLPLKETTVAETLRDAGYETAFFGKWHLNAHHKRYLGWSPTHGPRKQGFQIAVEDFGGHPYSWGRSSPDLIHERGLFPKDSMIEHACDHLREQHDEPYFAMVSQFYVHTPVKTPCRWLIEKYERLIPADSPAREKRLRYAVFVETLDHYVGEILNAIDESGDADNTLVIFTSDNGGHPEYTANGPLRGSKWNLYEGGIRVPLIVRWPNHCFVGAKSDQPVVGYDLHATIAQACDSSVAMTDGISFLPVLKVNNALPERPLIWHFPYYHPERGFAKAPDGIGVDDFLTSRTRPHSAIRLGPYKLVYFYEKDTAELYHLENDRGEQVDLSEKHPELTSRLVRRLKQELSNANARLPTRATSERD